MNIYLLCKKYNIINYTVNSDLSIDVNGDVNLLGKSLTKLPLEFNTVSGYFDCSWNLLTSLEGSPKEVGGDFLCQHNKIVSLEGCPNEVSGSFYCFGNYLANLKSGPKKVAKNFDSANNKLTSLEGYPNEIGGDFYCQGNELLSIEWLPNKINNRIYIDNNPIHEIYNIFYSYNGFIKSLDFNYLKGNKINKIRFERALEEQNLLQKLPLKFKYYEYI